MNDGKATIGWALVITGAFLCVVGGFQYLTLNKRWPESLVTGLVFIGVGFTQV